VLGVNDRYVADAAWLYEHDRAAVEAVKSGDVHLYRAVSRGRAAEREREWQHERTALLPLPMLHRARCIVIDPPWPMRKIARDVRPHQDDALDYRTIALEAIEALPVGDVADPAGCHLYLWTTHKLLPAALRLAEAWGFRYECLLTWVKPGGMTPYSWMYNSEHCLFARRGHLPLVRQGLKLAFDAPVVRHSQKPDVFYERVVAASPGPRLEMFARAAHEGFEGWGDEYPLEA
jgi:N6-adenosine-specific RNA methylase IME4